MMSVVIPQGLEVIGNHARFHEILEAPGLTAIRVFAGEFVPGLVQCPSYSELLFTPPVIIRAAGYGIDMASRVKLRQAEQHQLFYREPPVERVMFIMGEQALFRLFGHPSVLREQCLYLLDLNERENVEIRICSLQRQYRVEQVLIAEGTGEPFGNGPVTYQDQGYAEQLDYGDSTENGNIVSWLMKEWQRECEAAFGPAESTQFIEDLLSREITYDTLGRRWTVPLA